MSRKHSCHTFDCQLTIFISSADIIINAAIFFAKVMKHSHNAHIICFTLKENS